MKFQAYFINSKNTMIEKDYCLNANFQKRRSDYYSVSRTTVGLKQQMRNGPHAGVRWSHVCYRCQRVYARREIYFSMFNIYANAGCFSELGQVCHCPALSFNCSFLV